MKIMTVINTLSGGGAEVFVTDLVKEFKRLNNDVVVVVYGGILDIKGHELNKKLLSEKIKVINLNIKLNLLKVFIPFILAFIIIKIRPVIIHSHLDQSDFFTAIARRIIFFDNKPLYVRTLHNNNVIKRIPQIVNKWVFKQFDKTFSCSQSVKDNFEIKEYRNTIISIPNGISMTNIDNIHVPETKFRNYINILSIGSFGYRHGILQKGQDILIYAAAELHCDNLRFHFVGSGAAIEDIKELAEKLNISQKCIFHGQIANVHKVIESCQIVCFPSRFEGLPIAAIESVVLGKPIIVSNISAFDPFEETSKVLFISENYLDLAEKISYTISKLEEIIEAGNANIPIHKERFNIENVANNYLNTYVIK